MSPHGVLPSNSPLGNHRVGNDSWNEDIKTRIALNLYSSELKTRKQIIQFEQEQPKSKMPPTNWNDQSMLVEKPIESFYSHYQRPLS